MIRLSSLLGVTYVGHLCGLFMWKVAYVGHLLFVVIICAHCIYRDHKLEDPPDLPTLDPVYAFTETCR